MFGELVIYSYTCLFTLEADAFLLGVPERVLVVKFLPSDGVKLVAAGDTDGNVGFWNLDCC